MKTIIIDGNNLLNIGLFRVKSNIEKEDASKLEEWWEGAFRKLFLLQLKKLQKDFGYTSHYYIVWDHSNGSSWRKKLVPGYKGTRSHSPYLITAIAVGKQLAEELYITNIEIENAEADDVIYTLCRDVFKESSITIVSRDRDMLQIVQQGYAEALFDPVSKSNISVPPYDIILYKALTGDASDNIPGIKGIGPAKAQKLLENNSISSLTVTLQEELENYIKIIDLYRNPSYTANLFKLKDILND